METRPLARAVRTLLHRLPRGSESGFISIDYPGVYSPSPDMDLGADWPIAILATQDVACGVRLWRTSGQQRATVVVKATFSLVDGGPMRLVGPEPILVNDQHLGGNPAASVIVPSDLSPYMPRADVILSGHAQAPSGAPATQLKVRLSVAGQRSLVDKTVMVHGERVLLEDGSASQAVPFTRVPLLYERAVRSSGTDENPVGMTPSVGAPLPNIVDPSDPSEPAGLGAIASTWPARKRLLRQLDPAQIDAPVPDVPDTFAWSYFHAAPPDQRCGFFEGNEWLILEGLDPERRELRSQLPGVRAEARLYDQTRGGGYKPVELVADTLYVDADRGLACLTWRGNTELGGAALENLTFLAGLEMTGRTIPWPENERPVGRESAHERPREEHQPSQEERRQSEQDAYRQSEQDAYRQSEQDAYRQQPISDAPAQSLEPRAPAGASATRLEGGFSSDASAPQLSVRSFSEDLSSAHGVSMVGSSIPDVQITQPRPAEVAHENVPISQQPTIDLTGEIGDADPSTRRPGVRERFGVTTPTPPSVLRELMAEARPSRDPSTLSPRTMASAGPLSGPLSELGGPPTTREPAAPQFEEEETFQPGAEALARLVEDAEASSREEPSVPFAPESSTGDGMSHISGGSMRRARPPKTTRRGLGDPAPSSPALTPPRDRVSDPPPGGPPLADVTLQAQAPAPVPVGLETVISTPERPTVAGRSLPPRDEVLRCITFDLAIRDLDLDGVDLAGLDLSGRVFEGSRLSGANLRGANLRKAKLKGCIFDGADMSQTNLEEADLTGASVQGAILNDAKLSRARIGEARFDGAIGTNTTLDEATGEGAQFVGARFDCARFDGARLINADFTEAIIDGASFVGAVLSEARFYEARGEAVSFVRASFAGARLDAAVLRRGDFREAHANDTLWDQAELDQAIFHGARLTGASFTQSSCREVVFDGADLGEARFNKAVLWGARFVNANVASTTFEGADLRGASLPPVRPPTGQPPPG